jgi:hypothetical protein
MDEARRTARRSTREIVLFHERDPQPPECRVASDATASDAAANDKEVELLAGERVELSLPYRPWLIGPARQIVLRFRACGRLSAIGIVASVGALRLHATSRKAE